MAAAAESAAATDIQERAAVEVAGFFDDHARMVLALCRTHLRDPLDAEDAAQQTFLSAYRALLGGTRPRDGAAWLATIARNECRARIAKRLARPDALPLVEDVLEAPAGGDPHEVADRRAQVARLRSALADLPERQREAVVLRDVHGLSYDEVAAAMSVSEAAVDSLLSRGRRRLESRVRPLRVAQGVLVVPPALRERLAEEIAGFPAVPAGTVAAGLAAKLWAAPVAAKLLTGAAVVGVAVGTPVALDRLSGGHASVAIRAAAAAPVPPDLPAMPSYSSRRTPSARERAQLRHPAAARSRPNAARAEPPATPSPAAPAASTRPAAAPVTRTGRGPAPRTRPGAETESAGPDGPSPGSSTSTPTSTSVPDIASPEPGPAPAPGSQDPAPVADDPAAAQPDPGTDDPAEPEEIDEPDSPGDPGDSSDDGDEEGPGSGEDDPPED